jgi:nucleoid DNA-binding protein
MVLPNVHLDNARKDVWRVLIEKHNLSYDEARMVINHVGNEIRDALKRGRS